VSLGVAFSDANQIQGNELITSLRFVNAFGYAGDSDFSANIGPDEQQLRVILVTLQRF
jgi:hypothetical protein